MAGILTAGVPLTGIAPARQQHILGLDTVRAYAALSVVAAHILGPQLPSIMHRLGLSQSVAELFKYIFTGHPAVIVFFVVSGFCIHFPYTRRGLPVIAFTLARWTRIMPPALIAMWLAYLLHVKRYNFVDGFILWSIVCELWYYSLYPLLLYVSRKVSFEMQFLAAFLISLMLVNFLGTNEYGAAHIYGPSLNWLVALPSWLLGCVLAKRVASEGTSKKCAVKKIILWRAFIAIVAAVLYWLTLNTPIGYYLTMNFFAVLVFFWVHAEISAPKNANSLFERIGKWSYSIYLFHIIFLALVSNYLHIQSIFISISLILILCYLFYIAIERPSHRVARQVFENLRVKFHRYNVAYS